MAASIRAWSSDRPCFRRFCSGKPAKGNVFENRVGWTIGAGAEWAFARNLSAKLEYLYYDLGVLSLTGANISPLAHTNIAGAPQIINATTTSTRFNGHILRAGLNYRFDWGRPDSSTSAATPLFVAPEFTAAEAPAFGDWRLALMPYNWAVDTNGGGTVSGNTVATNVTLIDVLTKSSSFPLAFMGRFEARNGPVSFYGDVAWLQIRFAGSTLALRSPFADVALAVSAGARLKETIGIGEAGGTYEIARWKPGARTDSFTAIDIYAGLRYWFVGLDLTLDAVGAANSQLLGFDEIGTKAFAKSGNLQWIDPVIGLGLRQQIASGHTFQLRGDIGGFGVGSKFSWQTFGGYNYDFTFSSLNLTGMVGYRAVSVDYSRDSGNRRNGLNAILHGPVIGLAMRF